MQKEPRKEELIKKNENDFIKRRGDIRISLTQQPNYA